MTVVAEFNVSDFVRNPSRVIEQVERGEVILHRRGETDLRLTLASRDNRSFLLDEALARLVVGFLNSGEGRETIRETMTKVYPWLRFLPEDARDQCVHELMDTAVACASIRNYAAYEGKVASWRSTAEIYSDPELFAKLSGPIEVLEDHGRVTMPEVP